MFEEIKVAQEVAKKDVQRLMDSRVMLPRKRKSMQQVSEIVEEAVMYGLVVIHEDLSVTQKLAVPLNDTKGAPFLNELKYRARVSPEEMSDAIEKAGADAFASKLMVHMTTYTGQPAAIIKKLEPVDRNIAESIALFFM